MALIGLTLAACQQNQPTSPSDGSGTDGEEIIDFDFTPEGAVAAKASVMVGTHSLPTIPLREQTLSRTNASVGRVDNSPFDLTYNGGPMVKAATQYQSGGRLIKGELLVAVGQPAATAFRSSRPRRPEARQGGLEGGNRLALYPLHTEELAVLLDVGYSRADLGADRPFIESLFVGRAKGSPFCPEPACPAEETAVPVSPPNPRY